jgi:hypothetical protein
MNNHVLLQIVECLSFSLHLMVQVFSSRACDDDLTQTRASLAFLFTINNDTLHNTVFVPTDCTVYRRRPGRALRFNSSDRCVLSNHATYEQ